MRKFLVLLGLIAGLAALAIVVTDASAKNPIVVGLTSQQVANVCGKNLVSGGGHSGCVKDCGPQNKYVCDFDCNNKTGKCGGQCLTCPARKFPFGQNFPAHVVKQTLRWAH